MRPVRHFFKTGDLEVREHFSILPRLKLIDFYLRKDKAKTPDTQIGKPGRLVSKT